MENVKSQVSELGFIPKTLVHRHEVKPTKKVPGFTAYLIVEGVDAHGEDIMCVMLHEQFEEDHVIAVESERVSEVFARKKGIPRLHVSCRSVLIHTVQTDLTSVDHSTEDEEISRQAQIQRFRQYLERAVAMNASDIHFNASTVEESEVQYRIHGTLETIDTMPYKAMEIMISAIYNQKASESSKEFSFSTSQTVVTQMRMDIKGMPYTLRFISKPSYPSGSFTVVIRLLKLSISKDDVPSFDELGYSQAQLYQLNEDVNRKSGLLVVAGKVNQGKSTTLQAAMVQSLRIHPGSKAYSIEMPVEYIIPGVKQIEVQQRHGETITQLRERFGKEASDLLQMDLNYLLIGEIRTPVVGEIAQSVIQSGHKVLSTVHTNRALNIFQRLHDLGLEASVMREPGFFSIMMCQQLLARPCPQCSHGLSDEKFSSLLERFKPIFKRLEVDIEQLNGRYTARLINRAVVDGHEECKACHNRGTIGRSLIAEVIRPNTDVLSFLSQQNKHKAYQAWRKSGSMTLEEHAVFRLLTGDACAKDVVSLLNDEILDAEFIEMDQLIQPTDFRAELDQYDAKHPLTVELCEDDLVESEDD